jgi:hypothetical protein
MEYGTRLFDQGDLHAALGEAFERTLQIGNADVVWPGDNLLGGDTRRSGRRGVADLSASVPSVPMEFGYPVKTSPKAMA